MFMTKAIVTTSTASEQTQEQAAATEKVVEHITDIATEAAPVADSKITDEHKIIEGSESQLDEVPSGLDEPQWSSGFNFTYLFVLLIFAVLGAAFWYSGGARLFRRLGGGNGQYRRVDEDLEKAD